MDKKLEKNKKLVLAPMAGITDLPFRLVCKELGADILYSEMVSATGLFYDKEKSLTLANSCKEDNPLVVQLFGSIPKHFEKATKIIDSLENEKVNPDQKGIPRKPEGIDINFGCPVKKVMKQGSGCALMRDPALSYEIIKSVLGNTTLPVSIKIRAGIENHTALEFLEKVSPLPWQTVMIHARTFKEGFSGPIDLELIKKVKCLYPEKKVIANGGIFSPEEGVQILEQKEIDGIAIARGSLGNPWIFKQTKDLLQKGSYEKPSPSEIKKAMQDHLDYFIIHQGEKKIMEMRKHLAWYLKGIPGAKEIRKKIFDSNSYLEIKKLIDEI